MPSMRFSASRRGLLDQCGWPFRPDCVVEDALPEVAARGADIGTLVHGWIEVWLRSEKIRTHKPNETTKYPSFHQCPPQMHIDDHAAAFAMFLRWRSWWEDESKHWGRYAAFSIECPMALDLASGKARVLPRASHRDYSAARPGEVVGTADLIGMRDGVLTVYDWKSKMTMVDLVDARPQLRTLCSMALGLWDGEQKCVGRAVYISPQQVLLGDEVVLTPEDARADVGQLAGALKLAEVKMAEPVRGDKCHFCPARQVCPLMSRIDGALGSIVGRRRRAIEARRSR